MQIKNLMTKKVIFVNSNTNIGDAAKLMEKHRIHGLPVVDNKKLVGIITETDFFVRDSANFHIPSYIDFIKNSKTKKYIKNNNQNKIKIKNFINTKVKDIMTHKCITVDQDMLIKELLKIIKKTKLQIFPVVDKNQNLLGVITLSDIIKLFKI